MSFKDKFKSLIGIDDEEFDEVHERISPPPTFEPAHQKQQRQPLRAVEPRQTNKGQEKFMNAQALMSKVIIREPKDFSDAQNIADCLKDSLPVFINLQRLDKSEGRRVIDFLSGTIYAIDGEINRVGNELFLCTPNSVETDGSVTDGSKGDLAFGEL